MYRFLDRELDALDDGALLLVRAVRLWVTAVAARKCPADAITGLFLDQRLVGGIGPFHRVMTLLAVHADLPIGFARPCCPVVAEGEALLLSLLDADDILGPCSARIVGPCHAANLQQAVLELDAAMQLAGITAGVASR